jgi:hypothetical protein
MPRRAVRRPIPGLLTDRCRVRARGPHLRRTVQLVPHASLSGHGRHRHSEEARSRRPISAARRAGATPRSRNYCPVGNRCSRSKSQHCGARVENGCSMAVVLASVERERYMLASSSRPGEAAESSPLSWSSLRSRSACCLRSASRVGFSSADRFAGRRCSLGSCAPERCSPERC